MGMSPKVQSPQKLTMSLNDIGKLTITIRSLHLGSMAPLVHHFLPLMTYESPSL